jgi:hypothetical protein
VIHASNHLEYQHDLYDKLKQSEIYTQHLIVFPHEADKPATYSKHIIADSDLIVADISFPSIGLGIELGWAETYQRRIIAIYKEGCIASTSVKLITNEIIEYATPDEMLLKLKELLSCKQMVIS